MNWAPRYRGPVEHSATVRELWCALAAGNLTPLRERLAADARWRAVVDGPWNCDGPDAITDVMGRSVAAGLSGAIEEVLERDDRVLVAFRPDRHEPGAWPLEDGVRWLVVTFDGELVSELKGCRTRADAIAYAAA